MPRAALLSLLLITFIVSAEPLPLIDKVASQPLLAHVKQLEEALDFLGNPLPQATIDAISAVAQTGDDAKIAKAIQEALDPLCIAAVEINPESRVKVSPGPAEPQLVEQGWRLFLLKVHNEAGVTAELKAQSANALPMANSPQPAVADRWLDLNLYIARPMNKSLSGLELEYRILQLYSRDAGKRSAK